MVLWGTTSWRQENGRPMLIVGSRPAVYLMAVIILITGVACYASVTLVYLQQLKCSSQKSEVLYI